MVVKKLAERLAHRELAKPVEGAENRPRFVRQMPEPRYGVTNRLNLDAERYQYQTEGNLLGVCRLA